MLSLGETVLEARGIGKLYSRSQTESRRKIAEDINRSIFGTSSRTATSLQANQFWALKDVGFSVRRGKALGIIGLNGSGKTTLLRILADQIIPDEGTVGVWGQSASMIDLTAGFQMAASGRDNIFLRSAALGRGPDQVLQSIEQIISFSELSEAIDAPVATYSSGMIMRLAFSIMMAVEPDILLIDEVLAVGDFRFRQKCLTRLREVRDRSSFVMVSHSMNDIARFCDDVMVLHQGKSIFLGEPDEAIATYQSLEQGSAVPEDKTRPLIPEEVNRKDLVGNVHHYWSPADEDGSAHIIEGKSLKFYCEFDLKYVPGNLVVGVPVYQNDGTVVTGLSTDDSKCLSKISEPGHVSLELHVPNVILNCGNYRAAIGITDGVEFLYMTELPNIIVEASGRLNWGDVTLPYTWVLNTNNETKKR